MKIFWFLGPSDPDHQREDLSGVLRGSRWALWSLLLTCVVFFTWAYFAEIDQITRAPGSVISSARSQIIQQAGMAMLAQANQQPQMVLSLLR